MTRTYSRASVSFALLAIIASACTQRDKVAHTNLPDDDKVLADVNGSSITKYDVDVALKSMVSPSVAELLDEAGRKQLLESLVQSRAIAQKRETELNDLERAALDKKLAAYRESLLVKDYVANHTRMDGVSDAMVARYYKEHAARFGATKQRAYELIATQRVLTAAERTTLTKSLEVAAAQKDWFTWIATLQKKGVPVAYQRGQATDGLLHPTLRSMIERLAIGQASVLTFVQDRAYIVRPTGEIEQPPKPLAAVSDEIRETLVPAQLKKSVEEASSQVMQEAKVAYR